MAINPFKVVTINPFKVAGFESQERLHSSEIKGDCLRFILRGSEGYLGRELIYKVINSCFREEQPTPTTLEIEEVKVAINHFRAGFFFLRASNTY